MFWGLLLLAVVEGVDPDISIIPSSLPGSYSMEMGDGTIIFQLTIHSNNSCDFEFFLGDSIGLNVTVPKLWTLSGMDITFNATDSTVSILSKNESSFPDLFSMRTALKPLGSFKTPILARVVDDGVIRADISGLPVELVRRARIDILGRLEGTKKDDKIEIPIAAHAKLSYLVQETWLISLGLIVINIA
jgi:hypothetical protein